MDHFEGARPVTRHPIQLRHRYVADNDNAAPIARPPAPARVHDRCMLSATVVP